MNICESFAQYMDDLGIATPGQDIIIGGAPSSNKSPDDLWWILMNGGAPLKKNSTGESLKSYQILVYRRGRNVKVVQDALFSLEETLNCDRCTQLDGYDTVDIEVTAFPIDNDLDSEDRKVGLLQVTVTTYKEC